MKLKDCKCYLPFIASVLLFIVTAIWFVSAYIHWNGKPEEEIKVEIKLPVIEWNKYTNLSKQYDLNKIDRGTT